MGSGQSLLRAGLQRGGPGEVPLGRLGLRLTGRARSIAKWVGLALVVVFVMSAFAGVTQTATGALPGATPKAESTLRLGAVQEPDSLNPFVGVLSASYTIWAYVYELPIAIGLDLTPTPSLVQSWEVEDEVNWTWHMVENATWHDGTPFTANDMNFTMRYMWPQTPLNPIGCDLTLLQGYLGDADAKIGIDVDNVTVIDDYTLRVPTWQPKSNILSMFFFVIPEHVWSGVSCPLARQGYKNLPPIGTGMYSFNTYVRGAYAQLDLYQDYWRLDPDVDYIDHIIISYYTDDTALYNDFRAGVIDATSSLATAQYVTMPTSVAGGTNNVGKFAVDAIGFAEMGACVASDDLIDSLGKRGGRSWLVTNTTVRRALQYAVNREVLVETIKEGLASPGSTIIPPATPFWHYTVPAEESLNYDPDRARETLNDPKGDGADLKAGATDPGQFGQNLDPAAANNRDAFIDIDGDGVRDVVDATQVETGDWMGSAAPNRPLLSGAGGGLTLDISIINTDVEAQNAVENFMVEWWGQVGIRVVPVFVSSSRQLTVTYDCSASLYTWGWGGDVDPDFLLSIMTTDQILYWQDAWYSNPTYDEMYLLQQTQVVLEERQETVREMQRIVYRDAPYLVFWFDQTLTVVRTDLFTGWGDWAANPGLGLTGYGNAFLMLQLRAGTEPVDNPPTKPVIEGTPPISSFVDEPQDFVGTSTDPEGAALTWTWSWDDLNTTRETTDPGVSESTTTYAWASPGSYNVTLTVDDGTNIVTSNPFQVFVLPRPAEIGWVAGTVVDATTSSPISGATVAVNPGGFSQPTNADGEYNITVPVGTYSVTASHSLYASSTETNVAVAQDATTLVNFELTPSRGWIAGTVTSSAGGPIAGVTVRATGPRERVGTTNSAGEYNLTVPPGTYSVQASLSGYVSKQTTGVVVLDGATTQVSFALDPITAPPPGGGLSILGAVAIGLGVLVVVIALVAVVVTRRRKREEELPAIMPPKPPSAP